MCLASKKQARHLQIQHLYCNGLGEHCIQFLQSDGALAVSEKIVGEFPKLKDIGGYELIQCITGNKLVPIPLPPEGYTSKYFKSLGSVKIFIRPIQQDIAIVDSNKPTIVVSLLGSCLHVVVSIDVFCISNQEFCSHFLNALCTHTY